MKTGIKKAVRVLLRLFAALAAFLLLWIYLQGPFAHRHPPFRPGYPQADLAPILEQGSLTQADYQLIYAQTGLAPAAVDDLLSLGLQGQVKILNTQRAFFEPPGEAPCTPLIVTTREHRYLDEDGRLLCAVPFAPLREGDIIVSLSTHTVGWTHGHAGLVVDPDGPVTLESAVMGSPSGTANGNHWRCYSTMLVLRPKADDETRHRVAELAMEKMDGVDYSLVSGVFGPKFQPLDGPHSAHCGYLPWYAWRAVGIDLDGDGGRIVTPADLTLSDKVEVVQVYGIDPAAFPLVFD